MLVLLGLVPVSAQAQMQAFVLPGPVGGKHMLDAFIAQELIYPQNALDHGIAGDVWLIFNVMQDGRVEDLRVWRGLDATCDAEALRLARAVQWVPGMVGDVPVDAEHSLAITFSPKIYRKWLKKRQELDAGLLAIPATTDPAVHSTAHVSEQPAPIIPGGESFHTWWQKNLRYPPEALRRNIQGPLRLRFIVEPSGNISNLHAITDIGGGCIQEASRMLGSLKWRPAILNGQRVRSQVEMEFVFRLP